jgi:hypothetical protein
VFCHFHEERIKKMKKTVISLILAGCLINTLLITNAQASEYCRIPQGPCRKIKVTKATLKVVNRQLELEILESDNSKRVARFDRSLQLLSCYMIFKKNEREDVDQQFIYPGTKLTVKPNGSFSLNIQLNARILVDYQDKLVFEKGAKEMIFGKKSGGVRR